MTSRIDTEELHRWCRVPMDELEGHPDAKVKIKVFDEAGEALRHVGDLMADEVLANNAAGRPTRWVLPAGPMEQYDTFIARVNEERISLVGLHVFHMDDFLDWQGRPLPLDHPYSLEGIMRREFYAPIAEDLRPPEEQVHWPRIDDIDGLDRDVEEAGGVDTVWGGMGFTGLVAFCEAPRSPWYSVTVDEYRQSRTRIVVLNDDTIIALAERDEGGLTHVVPPMALTIGFKAMTNTRRVVLFSTTGPWKRTAIRVLLFSEPTVEYPATLFAGVVPEVLMVTDRNTAASPLTW
jgi:glucosamine-6-phosphate deaminase